MKLFSAVFNRAQRRKRVVRKSRSEARGSARSADLCSAVPVGDAASQTEEFVTVLSHDRVQLAEPGCARAFASELALVLAVLPVDVRARARGSVYRAV